MNVAGQLNGGATDLPAPYYQDDAVTIYHGDCREILPGLPKVDLVLTDPPYGIRYNMEHNPQSKHVESHRGQTGAVRNDDVPFDPSFLMSVGKGRIIWGANCFASRLPDNPAWLVWDKVTKNGLNVRIAECELAWTDCVGKPAVFRHLWSGAFRDSERGSKVHPTQKPVLLMSWCATRPGVPAGVILDPFMGSGPTLRAAKDLGRKAIGIEIEERYCEIAAKRMAQEVLL
jgi:site-specific DNA-methyltransferase (adenine-specific)